MMKMNKNRFPAVNPLKSFARSAVRSPARSFRLIVVAVFAMLSACWSAGHDQVWAAEQPHAAELSQSREAESGRTTQAEWFGSELPWSQWSRMTGDWGGYRSALSEAGISIEGANVLDWSRVASGGLRRRSTTRSLLDLRLTIDLKSLTGVDAGTLWARYYSFLGRSASRDIGGIQNFSSIDFDEHRHQLAELWYEQRFFNETVRVKIGKVDANTEFAFAENAAEFMNGSMGFSPTIVGMPTYPDPAMSVNLFVYPSDHLYVGIASYDGAAQRGVPTGLRGPSTFFRRPNELFYIGEIGTRWNIPTLRLPGRLGIGGWHHNGHFERFDGGQKSDTGGLYVVLDQMIWRVESADEEQPKGIGMYFQYGSADESVSEIKRHFGGGFIWRGPIPSRDDDALGFGVSRAALSSARNAGFDKSYELAVETFFKIQITPWLSAKPDVQYIVNPSGDRNVRSAVVAGTRLVWTF
jgi:porin